MTLNDESGNVRYQIAEPVNNCADSAVWRFDSDCVYLTLLAILFRYRSVLASTFLKPRDVVYLN